MAINDSFLKVYFLGTGSEIKKYEQKKESELQSEFNAAFLASGIIGLLTLPYGTPLLADTLFRLCNTYMEKDVRVFSAKGIREAAKSPGLVGLIRGQIEN